MINFAESLEIVKPKNLSSKIIIPVKRYAFLLPVMSPWKNQNEDQILKKEFPYVIGRCRHSRKAI